MCFQLFDRGKLDLNSKSSQPKWQVHLEIPTKMEVTLKIFKKVKGSLANILGIISTAVCER
jgi:hypothetical protein